MDATTEALAAALEGEVTYVADGRGGRVPSNQHGEITSKPRPTKARRQRNYRAMGDEKLCRVYEELDREGEAYYRCLEHGSGDVDADINLVRHLIDERGL